MEDWTQLTKWVIDRIQTAYSQDIDLLLAVEGHCTDGDGHGTCFDYFIPATERGYALTQTFLIGGVGHDLYPRSWERVARSASFDEMALVLAGATILYARNPAAAARFQELQALQQRNLHDDAFVFTKAQERLQAATTVYGTLAFEDRLCRARVEAAYILQLLSEAAALMNHSFADAPVFSERQAYDSDPQSRIYACPELADVPEGFFSHGRALLSAASIPANRRLAQELIAGMRRFLQDRAPAAETPPAAPDATALREWYTEMSLTWRRLRYFCQTGQVEKAYKEVFYLQSELNVIAPEFGVPVFGAPEFDLLDSFDAADLRLVALRAAAIEAQVLRFLAQQGAQPRTYASLRDFLAANGHAET